MHGVRIAHAVCALAIFMGTIRPGAKAWSETAGGDLFRPADASLAGVVREGLDGSPTFRRLADEILGQHAIVYVQWGPALRPRMQGAVPNRMVLTPDGVRCLWVLVHPGSRPQDRTAIVGHELQHVRELLESGAIPNEAIGLVFARLDGAHASGTSVGIYETVAAMRVERVIAGEVRAFRRQRESTRNPDRR